MIGTFQQSNGYKLLIDDLREITMEKAEYVILEPEMLLTSTTISTGIDCVRDPMLKD